MATAGAKNDEPDPRDGPNLNFKTHHDVTDRKSGGKMVFTKLQQLLLRKYIKPEESEAGRRFTNDYLRADMGRTLSSLDFSSGGGNGDGLALQLDAIGRVREAVLALERANGPKLPGGTSTQLLVLCCVKDVAFSVLATRAAVSDETIKDWVAKLLGILADFYARKDKAAGRSTTVYTHEAASKRFEPELK